MVANIVLSDLCFSKNLYSSVATRLNRGSGRIEVSVSLHDVLLGQWKEVGRGNSRQHYGKVCYC